MRVLYFAWLREKAGVPEEKVSPPDDVRTVDALANWLSETRPGAADAFADRSAVRIAVNQEYVGWDHAVGPDDEVAFFPPVTGG